jgi:dTDP-4-dehydrorhamnose 3,5-epimerase-like enzyme
LPSRATHCSAGEAVLISGIYRVVHLHHRKPHLVVAIRGEVFPACRQCRSKIRYELVQKAGYIVDDWDLAGPRLEMIS